MKNLIGKNVIKVAGLFRYSEEVEFICDDGTSLVMYHEQECCECVSLEDFIFFGFEDGNLPQGKVISVDIKTNSDGEKGYETFTYTFYDITFPNGTLTLRWYGKSNGYYSESVDFCWKTSPVQ